MNTIQETIARLQLAEQIEQKNFIAAEATCYQLIQTKPKDAPLWFTLSQIFLQLNKPEQAVKSLLNAAKFDNKAAVEALSTAVKLSFNHNLTTAGFEASQALLKIKPDAETYFLDACFANCLNLSHRSEISSGKALELAPDKMSYQIEHAKALCNRGKITEALSYYQNAIELEPKDDEAYFRKLFSSNYCEHLEEEPIFQEHQSNGLRLEKLHPKVEDFPVRDKSARIRLGYVSKDFRNHSVAFFFIGMIKNHDPSLFEVFCYSDCPSYLKDDMTEKLKSHSEHWVDSSQLSDEQLYRQIRNDKIDILIDLIGLTIFPRMAVYAKKAAPVQISYLGYPNTSGLSRMDYRIIDAWSDPIGMTEQHNTETLIRLPSGFLGYTPEIAESAVSSLPALKNGFVTFGSFNVFPKITNAIIQAWANILLRIPNAKLLIKTNFFNEKQNLQQVESHFERLGVSKDRLALMSTISDMKSHLDIYGQIDLHLDTYPYNGTTTTCEALWQGVPTITLAGKTHRSRVGLSILNQVGLAEFATDDIEEYVKLATNYANNLDKLAELRKGMRKRLTHSKLLDTTVFVKELESELSKLV
jgi:predicted O-linked N-acetylglucosamine transferase (SPINDLY family)